jgi:hypothetical protein
MNGQHLRALPDEQLLPMISQRWAAWRWRWRRRWCAGVQGAALLLAALSPATQRRDGAACWRPS